MVDDATTHHNESRDGEFDPNAATCDGETAGKDWLASNISPRVDEWVGKTIGQFEIIQIIGTGGMGNVYEARQLHPHRSVALKIVKSAAASPATLHRFEMESEMLARLQHPGIAQVYDSGHQMQGETLLPFFAMEYVPGSRSITDYAQDEHLSREGRLELFLLVCNAVQYGHGRGVIHRDLKPSNILITSAGRPKVIDFGVALMAGSDEIEKTITITGRFVGTLQWASPEQCGEDPHDVDVRTDVYSLGVIMYQLLAGELPYSMKGVPLYRAPLVVRETKPIPLRSIDPTIPVEVEQILEKALSKERSSRYESVSDFAMDVRRFLSNQPILARQPSPVRRLKLYARRNQLMFKASIVAFLAIILGLTGLIWGLVESEKRSKELQELYVTARTATKVAEQRAYTSTIATVQASIANNSWQMARDHLKTAVREYRGWEWHYLHGLVNQSIGGWPVGYRPNSLVTSSDGESVAVAFEGVRVGIIDEKREVLRTIQMPERVNTMDFSDGGTSLIIGMADGRIALVDTDEDTLLLFEKEMASVESIASKNEFVFSTGHSDGMVQLWNIDGTALQLINSGKGTVMSLAFNANDGSLALGKSNGELQLWGANGERIGVYKNAHDYAVYDLVFLSNGLLVSVGGDGYMRVWDKNLSARVENIKTSKDAVYSIIEVGNIIATAGQDGVIQLWSTDDFSLVDTLRGHDDWIWSLGSIDDERLASVSRDGQILWWTTAHPTLVSLRTSDKLPAADIAFIWNDTLGVVSEFEPDVQILDAISAESTTIQSSSTEELTAIQHVPKTSYLITGDIGGGVRLWDVASSQAGNLLGVCRGQISSLAVSVHGTFVAAGTLKGEVTVWNIKNNSLVLTLDLADSNVLSLAFDNLGNTLFVSISREAVVAIDVASGVELWRQKNKLDVVALAYVKSLRALLTAKTGNAIQLLDESSGDVLREREHAGDLLRDFVLFPDEKRFATVLSDGTVSIWYTNTLGFIASFPSLQSASCIDVSSDGYVISIGGGGSSIHLMDGLSRSARLTNTPNE